MHETLVSELEMSKAVDKKDFFIIPKDNRELNYDKYFEKGHNKLVKYKEYNSSNTKQLSDLDVVKLLKKFKVLQNLII